MTPHSLNCEISCGIFLHCLHGLGRFENYKGDLWQSIHTSKFQK